MAFFRFSSRGLGRIGSGEVSDDLLTLTGNSVSRRYVIYQVIYLLTTVHTNVQAEDTLSTKLYLLTTIHIVVYHISIGIILNHSAGKFPRRMRRYLDEEKRCENGGIS